MLSPDSVPQNYTSGSAAVHSANGQPHTPNSAQPITASMFAPIYRTVAVTIPAAGRHDAITERQRQVAELAAQGKSSKEIARDLGIAYGTVKIHLQAVMRAFGLRSRVELVEMMMPAGGGKKAAARKLSARERDVIILVSEGLPSAEVADRLGIETGTVKHYLTRIFRKTGTKNRSSAAAWWLSTTDGRLAMSMRASKTGG